MTKTLPKPLHSLYSGFTKTKTVIVLLTAMAYFALCVQSGGSLWEWLRVAVCLLFYIVLPGFFALEVLGLLGQRVKALAAAWPAGYTGPLAVLLGTGFFAALYCVAMRLGILWLLQWLPVALSAGYGVLYFRRIYGGAGAQDGANRRVRRAAILPRHWMLILLFSFILLVFSFYWVVKNARPLAVGNILPNQDLYWNAGNAASFKIAFPPQDIRFVEVRLHYHYLTELLAGALSLVSGVSAYSILAFYLGPFLTAAMLLCLYRFGRLVWPAGGDFKPLLFTYSLFLFGCASLWKILPNGRSTFLNINIIHLVTNVNSQATAILYMCIFVGLFIGAARKGYRVGPVYTLVMVAAFFMLCFAKGPLAAIVVCSVAATLVLSLFNREKANRPGWRGLALGAALAVLFVVVYAVMFSSGANDSMTFSTHFTLERSWFGNWLKRMWVENRALWYVAVPALWVVQSFLMMPAQFPLYAWGVGGDIKRLFRLPPERLLFNGAALGGLAAFFLFNHPHLSQAYFLYTAIFFVCLLAVDGTDKLPALVELGKTGKTAIKKWFARGGLAFVAVCAAVGVATAGFLYVHMLGSGARQLTKNLGIAEKYPYELVMTPDDEAAMLWLKENTPAGIMFATNRIHTGWNREGISNVYSAICERQAFMEGFQYAKTNMGVSEKVITQRIRVNNALFDVRTAPEKAVELCRENGIDYVVYCAQMYGVIDEIEPSEDALAGMEVVFDSANVRIYKVPAA